MPTLTLNLATSAMLLGTKPELLLQFIQREALPGVLFFEVEPKVSVFTLAKLLNTTPEALMTWMEDEALAELIEDVEDDVYYEGEDAQNAYKALLAGDS